MNNYSSVIYNIAWICVLSGTYSPFLADDFDVQSYASQLVQGVIIAEHLNKLTLGMVWLWPLGKDKSGYWRKYFVLLYVYMVYVECWFHCVWKHLETNGQNHL